MAQALLLSTSAVQQLVLRLACNSSFRKLVILFEKSARSKQMSFELLYHSSQLSTPRLLGMIKEEMDVRRRACKGGKGL